LPSKANTALTLVASLWLRITKRSPRHSALLLYSGAVIYWGKAQARESSSNQTPSTMDYSFINAIASSKSGAAGFAILNIEGVVVWE
jgi:hypothetical protein